MNAYTSGTNARDKSQNHNTDTCLLYTSYQMMIMVITFTASMLSLMITISLASRKSFDAYGKLLQVMVEDVYKRQG